MKMTKRIAATTAAMVMAFSVMAAGSLTGFATEETVPQATIVIDGTNKNTYNCYQIFTGTPDTNSKFSVPVAFGEGVDSAALLTALGLGADDTAADAMKKLDSKTSDEVLAILKDNGVLLGNGTQIENGDTLDLGYYYIEETDEHDDTLKGDLLKIAKEGNLKIDAKIGAPRAEKKVMENGDYEVEVGSAINDGLYNGTFNDTADYSIGDSVPFQLTGTMPQNINSYDNYYYEFTDRLAKGFVAPEPANIIVKIDGNQVAPDHVIIKEANDGSISIRIIFDNIKAKAEITAASVVTVNYSAVLDTDAVTDKTGNTNGVHLTYSKDTTYNGEGYIDESSGEENTTKKDNENDTTTEDGVVVYTYIVNINKIDGESEEALEGVKFTLQNEDGEYATVDANGKFAGWVNPEQSTTEIDPETYTLVTKADGSITIIGLDSGTYTLTEVETLEGYTGMDEPMEFTFVPVTGSETAADNRNSLGDWVYSVDNGSDAFGSITVDTEKVAYDPKDNSISTTIENVKETYKLPETGGIGTTLFYVGGGITAAAAGIVLVARRRARKDQ